jgi:hypothetical protein
MRQKSRKYADYDFLIYSETEQEWLTVDVKCRKKWRGHTDLIVQTGRNGDKCADVPIQALIPKNGEEVHITGYETREEVLQATPSVVEQEKHEDQ